MSHRFCPRPLSRLAARAALAGVLLIVPAIAASAGAEPVACQKGRIVFSRFSPTWPDIYTMNACGQAVTRLTFNGGHFAKLSPNGELIAFSGPDPGASTSDIWIMSVDGSDLQDITNSPDRNDAFPAWSPDGQELAWSSEPSGSQAGQLFVMNLHSYAPHAITQPFQPPEPANASWSPDGRRIVFDEFPVPPALGQLWTVDPNGHDLRAITRRTSMPSPPTGDRTGSSPFQAAPARRRATSGRCTPMAPTCASSPPIQQGPAQRSPPSRPTATGSPTPTSCPPAPARSGN
jgi:dipeptidyl aminopeptidase/acylaminoacyl peptidase